MHLKIFKMDDKMDVHDLPKATFEKYFCAGFKYKTIVLNLEKHHSVKASVDHHKSPWQFWVEEKGPVS